VSVSKSVDVLVAEAAERVRFKRYGPADRYPVRVVVAMREKFERVLVDAGYPALVEGLSELFEATDPYYEDAAPGEELNGVWAQRFGALSHARVAALKALGGEVRVSGRAELEARLVELQGAVDRAHSVMHSSEYVGGPSERDAWQEAMSELGAVATQHQGENREAAAVDGETTTTKGGN